MKAVDVIKVMLHKIKSGEPRGFVWLANLYTDYPAHNYFVLAPKLDAEGDSIGEFLERDIERVTKEYPVNDANRTYYFYNVVGSEQTKVQRAIGFNSLVKAREQSELIKATILDENFKVVQ